MFGLNPLRGLIHWIYPLALLAFGVYMESSNPLLLIYSFCIAIGSFILGVRVWMRLSKEFYQSTESLFKTHFATKVDDKI